MSDRMADGAWPDLDFTLRFVWLSSWDAYQKVSVCQVRSSGDHMWRRGRLRSQQMHLPPSQRRCTRLQCCWHWNWLLEMSHNRCFPGLWRGLHWLWYGGPWDVMMFSVLCPTGQHFRTTGCAWCWESRRLLVLTRCRRRYQCMCSEQCHWQVLIGWGLAIACGSRPL